MNTQIRPTPDKDRVVDFFDYGIYDYTDETPFYWQSLKEHQFTPDQLLMMIERVSELVNAPSVALSIRQEFSKHKIFDVWFEKTEEARNRQGKLRSFFLEKSLSAFAAMKIRPKREFIDLYMAGIVPNILNGSGLGNTAGTLSKLALRPTEDFKKGWIRQAQEKLDNFRSKDLSESAMAMTIFHVLTGDRDYADMARIFLEQTKHVDTSDLHSYNLKVASQWFDLPEYKREIRAFDRSLTGAHSWLKAQFSNVAGISIADESAHFVEGISAPVDLRLSIGDRDVLVTIDGPARFNRDLRNDSFSYTGMTHAQTALLTKLHPDSTFVRINHRTQARANNLNLDLAATIARDVPLTERGAYKFQVANDDGFSLAPFFKREVDSSSSNAPAQPDSQPLVSPPIFRME